MARYNSVGCLPFVIIGGFLAWALVTREKPDPPRPLVLAHPVPPTATATPAPTLAAAPLPVQSLPSPTPSPQPEATPDDDPALAPPRPRPREIPQAPYVGLGDSLPSARTHRSGFGGRSTDPGNSAPSPTIGAPERQ